MENRTDQRVFWHGKLKKNPVKHGRRRRLLHFAVWRCFACFFLIKNVSLRGWISGDHGFIFPVSAAFVSFYDVVTGQKNLFLDFSVSGGANLYADTINEVLNPFNYVLLLFGRDRIYQAVNVLVLLYSTASAVTAHIFWKNSIGQTLSECSARPLLRMLRVHGI